MLEFRWIAGLALWTILSGPVFIDLAAVGPAKRPAPATIALPRPHHPAHRPALAAVSTAVLTVRE